MNFEFLSKLKLIEEAHLGVVAVFVGDLREAAFVAVRVVLGEALDRQEAVSVQEEVVSVDLEGALAVQEASVDAGAVGANQHQLMLVSF